MPHSNISHTYRIDATTLARALALPGAAEIPAVTGFPSSIRLMGVNPAVFTHAYQLLGEHPQRFGDDIALYLGTVKTFFERADVTDGINLTGFGNADSRRRLSEDLGVACASLFMVQVFDLGWETISQIPQNRALREKRPDFQGFANNGSRFVFEAKGTTGLAKVVTSMSKAIGQVKRYPEQAEAKIAIVTYLCSDDRFFPSSSFVVDPPAMPEIVPSDPQTAKLLHMEKILQFVGLSETAKKYVAVLSRRLSEQLSSEAADRTYAQSDKLTAQLSQLRNTFESERSQLSLQTQRFYDAAYICRTINCRDVGVKLVNAVAVNVIDNAINLLAEFEQFESSYSTQGSIFESRFSDGTLLQVCLVA